MTEKKSNLEKLEIGLLVRSSLEEIKDAKHYVLGMNSHEVRFYMKQWEYALDLSRVLRQMEITVCMLENVDSIQETVSGKGWDESELIPYYQGVFLGQLYRLKERVFKLVNHLVCMQPPTSAKHDSEVKLKDLLENERVKTMNLDTLLLPWNAYDSGNKTGIGCGLRIRTDHTHYIDPLQLSKPLVDLRSARTILSEDLRTGLSAHVIQHFSELEKRSSENLRRDSIQKARNTLEEAKENIEQISEILLKNLDLTHDPTEVASVFQEIQKRKDSLRISPLNKEAKIFERLMVIAKDGLKPLQPLLDSNVDTIYLVFDTPVNDAPLIEFYFILKEGHKLGEKDVLINHPFITAFSMTKEQLLEKTKEAEKKRFVIATEGLCIYGEDFLTSETFPKPGLDLAILLNFDILHDMEEFGDWLQRNQTPSDQQLNAFKRKVSKRYIDFLFGIAMTNEPHFTTNRLERLEWIEKAFPENSKSTQMLGAMFFGKVSGTVEDLKEIIEIFKEQAKDLISNMTTTQNEIQKMKEKKVNR